jgi:hypothetical protein
LSQKSEFFTEKGKMENGIGHNGEWRMENGKRDRGAGTGGMGSRCRDWGMGSRCRE